MHSEILSDRQRELLPLMAQFRREYYLVGGTASPSIWVTAAPSTSTCSSPEPSTTSATSTR